MIKILYFFGQYFIFLGKTLRRPEKMSLLRQQVVREMDSMITGSLFLISVISFFMGAVLAIQLAAGIENPLIPMTIVGYGTRQSMILEFSSTVLSLILAGQIGSNITAEIGNMRISEQIDGLEVMGVNSINFLVLPKLIASILIFPLFTFICMTLGTFGGYVACIQSGLLDSTTYIDGITMDFIPYHVTYATIKMVFFATLITTTSAFRGYYVNGGSREVGEASTKAIVNSSISILIWNLILTQLLLL